MRSIYTQFADTARANGLILAPGGDGTPGRATASSPVYGRILESTRRMRDTRHALTRGQKVAGQRVDSTGKDRIRDASYAAHCLEWAGYFAQGDNEQRRTAPGMRSDADTIETIAEKIADGRFDALVPVADSVWLAGQMPQSTLHILPGAGHVPTMTRPAEVAAIIETPLDVLLDPTTRAEEEWDLRGLRMSVPFFLVGEHKVWGATAMILSELVERLRAVV